MTWIINPTVTIDSISYVDKAIGAVSIDYGRTTVWETTRAGTCRIQLQNTNNTNYLIDISDPVVIKVRNATNTADIIVFTGNVTSVDNSGGTTTAGGDVAYVTVTAVAPLTKLSRTQVGQVAYPQENESDRITRILNETGITKDIVDSGTYTLIARAIAPNDALTLCNAYANTATGAMYETRLGAVGYANENRRNQEVSLYGYFALNTANIVSNTFKSNLSQGDVINSAKIQYNGTNYVTVTSSGSQSIYGIIAGTLNTDIAYESDATTLANVYIGMRAYPKTSMSSVEIRIDDPDMDATTLNKMLNMYFGLPVSIAGLPATVSASTYYGFVEGWNLAFSQLSARITLRTTEKTYSFRPSAWEDVNPTLQWNAVDPTLTWLAYE